MSISVTVTRLPDSEVEIIGELPAERWEKHRAHAVRHLGEEVRVDGFRPGHVPEEVLIREVGEFALLEHMAEDAIREAYPEIIAAEGLDLIGRPAISIEKLAKGNPLGFKIRSAVMPALTLPDYRALARAVPPAPAEAEPSAAEVDGVLAELAEMRAGGTAKGGDATAAAPAIDDAFAHSLGGFESLADLKAKIAENVRTEKAHKAREERRHTIIERIVAATEVTLPAVLIDGEVDLMLRELAGDLAAMGTTLTDYLAKIGKTEADVRASSREVGRKRALSGLVLTEIRKHEKLDPTPEAVAAEVDRICARHKDADPERVRAYAEGALGNERVFAFLENLIPIA